MKTMKSFLVFFVIALLSQSISAQVNNLKSDSLKVLGNCDMCKTRIEAAAKSAGAVNPSWDIKTKILSFSYDPSKSDSDVFAKKVAAAGHDTEKFKTEDKTYNDLPACCKYERGNFESTSVDNVHQEHGTHSH